VSSEGAKSQAQFVAEAALDSLVSKLEFYHFTSVDNLPTILEHGLLSLSELKSRGIRPTVFDRNRHDTAFIGGPICLSVGFPHRALQRLEDHSGIVILKIHPEVWFSDSKKIASPTNAASNQVSEEAGDSLSLLGLGENRSFLRSPYGLFSLFVDPVAAVYKSGYPSNFSRTTTSYSHYWPNDPQAELQFESEISADAIQAIFVPTLHMKWFVSERITQGKFKVAHKPKMFRPRSDSKYWIEKTADVQQSIVQARQLIAAIIARG
jgi:hypothetical protein